MKKMQKLRSTKGGVNFKTNGMLVNFLKHVGKLG